MSIYFYLFFICIPKNSIFHSIMHNEIEYCKMAMDTLKKDSYR